MSNPLLIIIILGLAAALMPLQFATEVYLFGKPQGPQKAAALVGGITLFRIFLLFVLGILFASLTTALTDVILWAADFAAALLSSLDREIVSGQRAFVDLLLVLSGVLLLVEIPFYYRASKGKAAVSAEQPVDNDGRSTRSYFLMGIGWTAISLNQWLFTLTAVNQILIIRRSIADQAVYSLLYLLLASWMIMLPFFIYLLKPERAGAILERISRWMSESLVYLIMLLMAGGGIYFIWKGGQGLLRFLG